MDRGREAPLGDDSEAARAGAYPGFTAALADGAYLAIHREYDPPRGRVLTADRGWIDRRKAKRLRRKGLFKPARPWKERAREALAAWKALPNEQRYVAFQPEPADD